MAGRDTTEDLVLQVIADLHARYALDDGGIRALGAKLAAPARDDGRADNLAFAKRFIDEHQATFSRLAK